MAVLLSNEEKHTLEDWLESLNNLTWENGQYTFADFVEHFDLPQVVRLQRSIFTNAPVEPMYMFIHSIFDRYAIIAKSKDDAGINYLISDWCKLPCRIISANPTLKARWWVFQSAFELFRFDFPRKIKILSNLPVHRRTGEGPKDPWVKVVLNRDIFLTAVSKCTYQSVLANEQLSASKEGFVLRDEFGGEYIIPPAVPLRFATEIRSDEIQAEYKNHQGEFSLSEVLMRYEFPISVALDIPGSNTLNLHLMNFCVAKSVIAITFGRRSEEPTLLELSPEKDFLLHCHKSLTVNLPRAANSGVDIEHDEDVVTQPELNRYNDILSKTYALLRRPVEAFKEIVCEATADEVACVRKAHEISIALDKEANSKNRNSVYMTVENAIKFVESKKDQEGIPFNQNQPKNFTVHICADPANPYNEAIDYELLEEDEDSKTATSAPGSEKHKVQNLCEAVVMQADNFDPIPKEVFAKTVRDIPDYLILVSLENKQQEGAIGVKTR